MNKEEFKRLERADTKARKRGNKQALYDWGMQLENQLIENLNKQYEERFKKELLEAIDSFLISLMYVLHFSEKTKKNVNFLRKAEMINIGEESKGKTEKVKLGKINKLLESDIE